MTSVRARSSTGESQARRVPARAAAPASPGRAALRGLALAAAFLGAAHSSARSVPAPLPAPAAQPATAFSEQAAQLGVGRCAALFSDIGRTATAGANYAVQVQADAADPDAHAVQGVAGLTYDGPESQTQAAAIVLAAPAARGCEGQMVRVAPFQVSCAEVLDLLPAGSAAAGNLAGVALHDLGGNQGQAMLVPNGDSCVVVSVARMVERR